MDFVVIGLGLSALALLTGLTLLCMVAPRWFRKSRAVQPADAVYARALAGARHALGQGFLCVGAVLLLATLGGISAGLADKAGAYLIAAMTTVAALGLFGWDVLYRRQHPVPQRRRVVPARQREAPTSQPVSALSAADDMVEVEPESEAEMPPAAAQESVAEAAAPQAAGSEIEPEPENHGLAAEPGPPEPPSAVTKEAREHASDDPVAEESSIIAAELPEPVPFAPARPNGVADLAAPAAAESDSEVILHGDDRVIALFPTAAARRSHLIVVPTDPDGKN